MILKPFNVNIYRTISAQLDSLVNISNSFVSMVMHVYLNLSFPVNCTIDSSLDGELIGSSSNASQLLAYLLCVFLIKIFLVYME